MLKFFRLNLRRRIWMGISEKDWSRIGYLTICAGVFIILLVGVLAVMSSLAMCEIIPWSFAREDVDWSSFRIVKTLLLGEAFLIAGGFAARAMWNRRSWFL